MNEVTIKLPNSTFVLNHAGEAVNVDWTKMPASVLGEILVGGANIILKNSYNSGGKDKKPDEKLAGMMKRLDSWYKGNYAITERASSQATLMREAYVLSVQAKLPTATAKQIEDKMKATVKAELGESENATFDNFLAALAKAKEPKDAPKRQEQLERLTEHWIAEAAKLEESRRAVTLDLDLTDFDI